MEKKDRIEVIQETIMRELARLDEDRVDNQEVARANAISQNATSFLKAANLKFNINKASNGNEEKRKELAEYMGVISEK